MRSWFLLALVACDWDLQCMNNQPRCEPGDRRPWLPDERCDQAPPEDTVPFRSPVASEPAPPPTRELVLRGADRFARVCAACHGALGDGVSAIALDMSLRKPPSLHTSTIVRDPDQRLYEVITDGYGLMPSYRWQLPAHDRWAVVYFVRALQRSQSVGVAQLSPQRRSEAASWLK